MAPREALDIALAGGAFDLPISMLFLDDGVFQLMASMKPACVEQKDLGANIKALPLFGVEHLYVLESSLAERSLSPSQLEPLVKVLSVEQARSLLSSHDMVVTL
jgi:tRNA 2-thiouridine synthesizing protein C